MERFIKISEEQFEQVHKDIAKKVNDAFPSVFSKEDVLSLLRQYQDELYTNSFLHEETQEQGNIDLLTKFKNSLDYVFDGAEYEDVIIYDTASFSINWKNHLELESCDIDNERINDSVTETIQQVYDEMIANLNNNSDSQVSDMSDPETTICK